MEEKVNVLKTIETLGNLIDILNRAGQKDLINSIVKKIEKLIKLI